MWLLPCDLSELGAHLPEGVHLLPGRYTEEDRACLLALMRGVLPAQTRTFELSERAARECLQRGVRFRDALVLVHRSESSGTSAECVASLGALGARYLLVQPRAGNEGTTWMEGALKVALMRWVRQELRRPDHPLATLGVRHLDVLEAASRTSDPVRLLQIVESAIAHRLGFARVGTERADWVRSLAVVAARFGARPGLAAREVTTRRPHRALMHMARELALVTASRPVFGIEMTAAVYADKSLSEELRQLLLRVRDVVDVSGEDIAAASRRAEVIKRVEEARRMFARADVVAAEFVATALEFLTSSVAELLARRDSVVAWVGQSRRSSKVTSWRDVLVRTAALRCARSLLIARRVLGDVSAARALLSSIETWTEADVAVELLACASFSVDGRPAKRCLPRGQRDSHPIAKKLLAFEGVANSIADAPLAEWRKWADLGDVTLVRLWTELARGSLRSDVWELAQVARHRWERSLGAGFVDVAAALAHFACGEFDEALQVAGEVLSGGEDTSNTIDRAFAHEIIGAVQAERGDVDAAIDAYLGARAHYIALEDLPRSLNIDARIEAARAATPRLVLSVSGP